MKIVIISDVHGNYDALRALPETYTELWVLGDLVNFGPEPAEVLDFIREKASIVIRGNHDQSVGYDEDPRCIARYQRMADATRSYTARVLSEEQKQFLGTFQFGGSCGARILAFIFAMRNHLILSTATAHRNLSSGSQKSRPCRPIYSSSATRTCPSSVPCRDA